MNKAVECIRCHVLMEKGFIPDIGHGGYSQQRWCPGEPTSGFWTGLKVKRRESIPVAATLRCPRCGYLESYAVADDSSELDSSRV